MTAAFEQRQHKGKQYYAAGQAAEGIVERHYQAGGYQILARRWRGKAGEIDLICTAGQTVVFVEVKKARTFDIAAYRLGPRQLSRLARAGVEYVGRDRDLAQALMRFDLALVDGIGDVRVIENLSFDGW